MNRLGLMEARSVGLLTPHWAELGGGGMGLDLRKRPAVDRAVEAAPAVNSAKVGSARFVGTPTVTAPGASTT